MNRGTFVRSALASLTLLLTPTLHAGPLNPPPGPITSTYKTLSEVEPRIAINSDNTPGDADSIYKITQPGSYYLTAKLFGEAGRHGIEIAASGVTIDLNGFELEGTSRMGAFDAITTSVSNLTSITIRNGSIYFWGDGGIDLSASNCIITDVLSIGNAGTGITSGPATIIRECTTSSNSNHGISASDGSTIVDCSARSNAASGILTANACTIRNCSAVSNANAGFNCGTTCTVTSCSAMSNGATGLSAGFNCTITACSSSNNITDGISVSSNCIVINNTCAFNGFGGDGAGIRVVGGNTRLEANTCTNADRGIDVDSTDNLIIRNTCSANTTNWDIVAGNHYGPIIDRTAISPAAVTGNSATDALGSTHPNANFTF